MLEKSQKKEQLKNNIGGGGESLTLIGLARRGEAREQFHWERKITVEESVAGTIKDNC